MTPAFARAKLAEFQALLANCTSSEWRSHNQGMVAYYTGVLRDLEPAPQPPPPARPGARWRSANEPAWAQVFDKLGLAWEYEKLEESTARALRYRPDFWLPDWQVFVEIKSGPPTPGEVRVARQLRNATGCDVYVLGGWPGWGRFGVWVFSGRGDFVTTRPDWAALCVCRWGDCGFSELRRVFEEVGTNRYDFTT